MVRTSLRCRCFLTFLPLLLLLSGAATTSAALGDLDADGTVTAVDSALLLHHLAGSVSLDAARLADADADADGSVSRTDAAMILRWATQVVEPTAASSSMDEAEAAVITSTSATVTPAGGLVQLTSGSSLQIPSAVVAEDEVVELAQCDASEWDATASSTLFRVAAATATLAASTLEIPFADLTRPEDGADGISGAVAVYYDPWSRSDRVVPVAYQVGAEGVSIPLDFLTPDAADAGDGAAGAARAAPNSVVETSSVYILVKDTSMTYVESTELKRVLPVPYYKQGLYGYCWACATTMALNYHAIPDDVAHPWTKPWQAGDYMNIGPDPGLSVFAFRFGTSYANYVKWRAGAEPERCIWPSSTTMKLYIKKQIMDEGRPVIVFFQQIAHYITIYGYEYVPAELRAYVYINDSASGMALRLPWDVLISLNWWNPLRFVASTAVVPTPASGAAPVSFNILGHRDGGGLAFTSPLKTVGAFGDDADTRFSWYLDGTTNYGFLASNGQQDDVALAAVPNYYGLDLTLGLYNNSGVSRDLVLDWSLMRSDGSGTTYSGTQAVNLAKEASLHLTHPGFPDLSGECVLLLELHPPGSFTPLDTTEIKVTFDDGIQLSVEEATGKLSWTAYADADAFEGYQVYRMTSRDARWMKTKSLAGSTTEWTDPDYHDFDGTVHYAVVAEKTDGSAVITSDAISVQKGEGTLTYLYAEYDADLGDYRTGIGVHFLATGETGTWPSQRPAYSLLLLGVTPSGRVAALKHDEVGDDDQLLLRDNWAAGAAVDLAAPCGLSDRSGFDRWETDLANDGNVYFTGTVEREVPASYPPDSTRTEYYDYIFRSDGTTCTPVPIDANGDGSFDFTGSTDDLSDYRIQQLVVAENGSRLAFEAYDQEALYSVPTSGGTPTLAAANCAGQIRISADGTRCLFAWEDPVSGDEQAASVPCAGGSPVLLGNATGLTLEAAASTLSSDGSVLATVAVQLADPIENSPVGLAMIASDGSSWRWVDTGTVQLVDRPRFAPGDQQLVFSAVDVSKPDYKDTFGQSLSDIYHMPVDGSEAPQRYLDTPTQIEFNAILR